MKFEILISILFELLSKKCVSATYLANEYGVSVRTIYRYIENLEGAGVPIYTQKGKNGGICIVDTYRLSSTFMTQKEFSSVINTLSSVCENVPDKTLEGAILKLKSTIKNEYSSFEIKSGNLVIDGGPWGDTIGYKSKLKVLQKCIDENLKLDITYHDRNGTISNRIIDPYIIVFKQGLWYVYAYCNLRQEFRFFKTGRIESAFILKEKFNRVELNNSQLPLDFWGNNVNSIDVSFEIDKSVLSDVEEWLGIENVYTKDDKHYSNVKLPYDFGLVSKIMSYGSGLKVLAPIELREKIKNTAIEISNNY